MVKVWDKLLEGTYTYNKCGLCINSKIRNVIELEEKVIVFFDGGTVDFYIDLIEEVKTDSTEWSYKLTNYLDGELGFITKIKE